MGFNLIAGCTTTSEFAAEQTIADRGEAATGYTPSRPAAPLPDLDSLGETPDEFKNNPWKDVATPGDKARLYQWIEALNTGHLGAVRAGQGEKLGDPAGLYGVNAVSNNSDVPEGLYNCAITKLGGPGNKGLSFVAYPAFKCRVKNDEGRKHFTKLTGSQRTVGWIYPASKRHSVYLGTLFYGYEDKAVPYGQTEERDQAAVVQHIGKDRWRMIFPWPYYESVVDVMDLTPVI